MRVGAADTMGIEPADGAHAITIEGTGAPVTTTVDTTVLAQAFTTITNHTTSHQVAPEIQG